MPQPCAIVSVDEQLQWVVRVPELLAGASRAATPEQVARLGARFDALAAALAEAPPPLPPDDLISLVARLVMATFFDPPELPLIGDPFGGQGGTD